MKKLAIRVFHAYYGCDSGCCGHHVEVVVSDEEAGLGRTVQFPFGLTHPGYQQSNLEFGRDVAEPIIAKNWPECLDSIDWSSIDVSEVEEY